MHVLIEYFTSSQTMKVLCPLTLATAVRHFIRALRVSIQGTSLLPSI